MTRVKITPDLEMYYRDECFADPWAAADTLLHTAGRRDAFSFATATATRDTRSAADASAMLAATSAPGTASAHGR